MQRVVVLPNGRGVPLDSYVAAWRKLKTLPAEQDMRGFWHEARTVAEILAALREGMMDRINRHVPGYGRGRKWDTMYQTDLARDSRAIRAWLTNRVRPHLNTLAVRERLGHLLPTQEDM